MASDHPSKKWRIAASDLLLARDGKVKRIHKLTNVGRGDLLSAQMRSLIAPCEEAIDRSQVGSPCVRTPHFGEEKLVPRKLCSAASSFNNRRHFGLRRSLKRVSRPTTVSLVSVIENRANLRPMIS